jgi:protein-S-isoprenylcysteine O-methyltransferase Ste14
MLPVLARLVGDATIVAALLFAAAGTLSWWRAWVLVAALLLVRLTSAVAVYRVNANLLRDRSRLPLHADQHWTDKLLLLGVLGSGLLGLPVVAGLDVFRWHVLPRPAVFVSSLGLLLFVVGWAIKGLALHANAFATAVVRLQREHAVVDSGVYRIVRHPFYAADPLILVGLGLWLESYLAALLSIVPLAFMVTRLSFEERFLRRELPGYAEYSARVPHRLFPGLW